MNLTTEIEKPKSKAGFFWRGALIFLTLAVVAMAGLPAQIRGYAYELYREAAKIQMEYSTRDLPFLLGENVKVVHQEADRDYAIIVLEASEKFYGQITSKYGLKPNGRVTVVVYPSREELNASFGWPASENAMGAYWAGVIRVLSPASWVNGGHHEVKSVFINTGPMAHELTHLAVDYATRGNCPRWLTEGLAQLEEYRLTGFRFEDKKGTVSNGFYSLKEMDRGFDGLSDQALAYRQSLSMIEYIDEVYGEDKLMEIISLLGKGKGISQSLEDSLGVDLVTFEEQWRTRSVN